MLWKYGVLIILGLCLVCGKSSAQEKDGAQTKAAQETLLNAFEKAKKTGRAVNIDVEPEDPLRVQSGDLVEVEYALYLEDGRLIKTTREMVARDPEMRKIEDYQAPAEFSPQEVMAGQQGMFDIGTRVLGMSQGELRSASLPPEKAFGPRDPKKAQQFPCEKRMPKDPTLSPQEYVGRFGKFPVLGKEVDLTPYFKSKVVEVTEDYVKLEALIEGGEGIEDNLGTTTVKLDGDDLIVTLAPKLGADFEVDGRKGRIVSTDGMTFIVDFNPMLAGRKVLLDLEVVSFTKASAFKDMEIQWVEDYEQALDKAKAENKPLVLLLYASWCGYSKKIMNETFKDPRIRVMKDEFIWAKVNSDERKELYKKYEQKGYPLTVVLNETGQVMKKIDGYKDAFVLKKEIETALANNRLAAHSPD